METAPDNVTAPRLEKEPIAFDDDCIVENNRDLLAGRPRPVAQRRDCNHNRRDANPDPPFLYGWPQCGQIALPSRRFFWHLGHGTRLPFGRVTR